MCHIETKAAAIAIVIADKVTLLEALEMAFAVKLISNGTTFLALTLCHADGHLLADVPVDLTFAACLKVKVLNGSCFGSESNAGNCCGSQFSTSQIGTWLT